MAFTFDSTPRQMFYSPDEEQSVWQRAGSLASPLLSGLGYVGSKLDKYMGARALRGLVGGRPREALSILPFSDALGITNPEDTVTGAQINANIFGTNPNPDLFSWGGLGGIATELALNPLNFASFGGGALTNLGKLSAKAGVKLPTGTARAAGLTAGSDELSKVATYLSQVPGAHYGRQVADIASDIAGKPLGGNIGLGLPFGLSDQLTADVMPALGKAGQAISNLPLVGQPLAKAGTAVARATEPLRTYMGGLFDFATRGTFTPTFQQAGRAVTAGEDAARLAAHGKMMNLFKLLPEADQAAINAGNFSEDTATAISNAIERYKGKPLPPELSAYEPFRQAHDSLMSEILTKEQSLGLPTREVGGPLGYLRRQMASKRRGFGQHPLTPDLEAARQEIFRNIPTRGARSLNELGAEPLDVVGEATKANWADYIGNKYLGKGGFLGPQGFDSGEWLDLVQLRDAADKFAKADFKGQMRIMEDVLARGGSVEAVAEGLTPAMKARLKDLEALRVQSQHLADWKLNTGVMERMFPHHPLEDILNRVTKHELNTLKATELHKGIAKAAMPIAEAGEGAVPLPEALKNAGLTMDIVGTPDAAYVLKVPAAAHGTPSGAMQQTLDALRAETKNPALRLEDLQNFAIPAKEAADISRMVKPMVAPAALRPFLDLWDSITNLTKTGQTVLWPANKMRNQMTAMWQHFVNGMYDPTVAGGAANPQAWIKPWTDAQRLRAGAVVNGLEHSPVVQAELAKRGLPATPEAATQLVNEWATGLDVVGRKMQAAQEVIGPTAQYGQGLRDIIPGLPQEGFGEQLGKLAGRPGQGVADWTKNFLGIRGVLNAQEDINPLVRAGRGVDTYLDDTNRLAGFISKLKQGFTPEAAKEAVIKAHYDYSALTPFERGTMRRLIPFYSWARQNSATLLKEIAQRPGGAASQSVLAAAKLRGNEPGFVPPHLGAGIAAPIGQEVEGQQRYLSQLGLPFEDIGGMVNPLQGTLGQLNPLIKYPLEQLTGRQFFTGRDLQDLYSRTGTAQPIENLLLNSPIGRAITTVGTARDPRKDIFTKLANIFTGVRFTDVNVAQAREQAVMQALESQLRGMPHVRRTHPIYFVPQNMRDQATPEELAFTQMLNDIRRR